MKGLDLDNEVTIKLQPKELGELVWVTHELLERRVEQGKSKRSSKELYGDIVCAMIREMLGATELKEKVLAQAFME